MADYLIRRQLNCTNIERRTGDFGFASQHWVLWPSLVVEMKFFDGVRVEHHEFITYVYDPTKAFIEMPHVVKIGKTYVINEIGDA